MEIQKDEEKRINLIFFEKFKTMNKTNAQYFANLKKSFLKLQKKLLDVFNLFMVAKN